MMIETFESEDPVSVTRGLSAGASVKFSIDWLSLTYMQEFEVMYPFTDMHEKGVEMKKGKNGYDIGIRYSSGVIELSSSIRRDMGTHIIMSGSVCQSFQDKMVDTLKFFLENGARIRRIDFTVDIFNSGLSFKRMIEEIEARRFVCDIRKKPQFYGDIGGEGATIYFGKKSASAYTKIYNKASERGIEGDWVRVETTYKDDKAQPAATLFYGGATIREMILSHVRFTDYEVWNSVFSGNVVEVHAEAKKENKTMDWLLRKVVPTLAREAFYDPMAWVRFQDAFHDELGKLHEVD